MGMGLLKVVSKSRRDINLDLKLHPFDHMTYSPFAKLC